jgi:iron complex outermembrane receptor protein
LYGSNGSLATINVVTKRPADVSESTIGFETDSLGERKASVSSGIELGRGTNLVFSTSVFNNMGAHELYFPEFDRPETNFGRAIDMDGERGYHAFVDLTWGNWEAMMATADRTKTQPISWGKTVFNDRGTRAQDARGFAELSYARDLPGDRTVTWRASYDSYRYRGTYHYAAEGGTQDNREIEYGDWIGSGLTYRFPITGAGYLTLGGEVKVDLRTLQKVSNVRPYKNEILWSNRPDRYAAIFAQQELSLSRSWEPSFGARFDRSQQKKSSVSPRIALIYKPAKKSNVKLLYGRGFRNPSSYNMFFDDGGLSQVANPSLHPETSDTFEIDLEHAVTRNLRASSSFYRYRVNDLIQQTYTRAGLIQIVNADQVRASGASLSPSEPAVIAVRSWRSWYPDN